jgi:hypothetical protein
MLSSKVELVSQKLWIARNASSFGVRFIDTRFTPSPPPGTSLVYTPLQVGWGSRPGGAWVTYLDGMAVAHVHWRQGYLRLAGPPNFTHSFYDVP